MPAEWVFQDEGYSGAILVRPGLEALRDLAAEGQIAAALVYSPDRLSRKYAYQVLLSEELSRCGVELIFLKAPAGVTPEDQLLVQFQGMIAEYERAPEFRLPITGKAAEGRNRLQGQAHPCSSQRAPQRHSRRYYGCPDQRHGNRPAEPLCDRSGERELQGFEDKGEQKIMHFASEDAPLSIGLVFDTSGSMGNKLTKSRQAVGEFFKTANPEDEFFLVQFNDRPELMHDFSTNIEDIQNRLTFTQAKGRTALLDAVYMALHKMKKAHNPRKALLIISDGGDNSSRYTGSEIKNLVREADVQIYAIGIFEPFSSRDRSAEELNGPGLLSELSEQTGGRHFAVENLNELPDVAAKIGIELRNQYILGYSSTNKERDGKYRKVKVSLVQPKGLPPLVARWRPGYYAPTQ